MFQGEKLRLSEGSCLSEATWPRKGKPGGLKKSAWPQGPNRTLLHLMWPLVASFPTSPPTCPTKVCLCSLALTSLAGLLATPQEMQPNRVLHYRCVLEKKCAPHWILFQTRGNSNLRPFGLSLHSAPIPSQAASHFIPTLGTTVLILQIRDLRLRAGT